jgi:S1-C subfamily serine protease
MNHHRPEYMRHRRMLAFGLLMLCVLLLAGCGGNSSATSLGSGSGGSDALQQNVINVISQVQPSVVEIESQGPQGAGIGSGEIWDTNGYLVTNDHVVAGFSSFLVRLGRNQVVPAQLIGESPQDDLAVLKIKASNLHPIGLGDSSKLQPGQFMVAVGNPLGLAETATFGIVSALNRTASEGPNGPASLLTGLIQTSAPINPGNSGGALVDLNGQLVGVPTLAAVDPSVNAPANGIGFAIPVNRVKFVTQQLIKNGKLVNTGQGFLGVQGQDVTPQLAAANNLSVQSGVLVAGFAPDAAGQSPAQRAGIQMGDVIVSIDGQAVASNPDIATVTLSNSPGTQVKVTVARGKNQTTVNVKLGQRPVST